LLHGVLVLVTIAVAAGLMAAGIPQRRIAWAMLTGFAAGLAVAIILGSGLSNLLWKMAGDALLPLAAEDVRPLAAALVVTPVVLGVLLGIGYLVSTLLSKEQAPSGPMSTIGQRMTIGLPAALYVGWLAGFAVAYGQGIAWFDWRLLGVIVAGIVVVEIVAIVIGRWRAGSATLLGLSIGAGIGVIVGVLTAIAFGWRVGIAIGIAFGLITWVGMAAFEATHLEFDEESLKKRFWPEVTINTTKETIEWAKAKMPLSRKS
jgi:hypothetical protein